MGRVRPSELTDVVRRALLNDLEGLFESCRSVEDLRRLLRTLLTIDERVMLGRRLQISRLLLAGKTHVEIAVELRVGADTIDRVRRWLETHRATYHLLMERIRRRDTRRHRREVERNALAFSWADIRRRYPLHFWPLELVAEVEELLRSYTNRRRSRNRK